MLGEEKIEIPDGKVEHILVFRYSSLEYPAVMHKSRPTTHGRPGMCANTQGSNLGHFTIKRRPRDDRIGPSEVPGIEEKGW